MENFDAFELNIDNEIGMCEDVEEDYNYDYISNLVNLIKNCNNESKKEELNELLCNSCIGYIRSIGKKYEDRGLEVEDLVVVGWEGLQHAIEKYNIEKGVKFLTFATNDIRGYMLREIENFGRTIRIPSNEFKKSCTLKKEYDLIGDYEVVGKKYNLSEREVREKIGLLDNMVELDRKVNDEDGGYIIDCLRENNEGSLEFNRRERARKELIKFVKNNLTNEEAQSLKICCNFDDDWYANDTSDSKKNKNINRVVKEMGITRTKAQNLLNSVERKLREANEEVHFENLVA